MVNKKRSIYFFLMLFVALFVSSCSTDKSTELPPETAAVTILLSTSDGGSAIGATVLLENHNAVDRYQLTATSSEVVFPEIVYGTYNLIIRHIGYVDYIQGPFAVQSNSTTRYTTLMSNEGDLLTGTLSIALSTDNQGSVVGAAVRLNHQNGVNNYFQTATGNTVVFSEVTYGIYEVVVEHIGYKNFVYSPILVQTTSVNHAIELISDGTEPPPHTAIVNINLSTNDGGSVIGSIILLENHDGVTSYHQSAAGSDVVFTGVNYGTYSVIIRHTGYNDYIHSPFLIQSSTVNHAAILVSAGDLTSTVTIHLSTDDGGSVMWALVILENHNGINTYTRTATSDVLTFVDIPFGIYTLIVNHTGYESYSFNPLNVDSSSISHSLTLISEGGGDLTASVRINLSTSDGGSIFGANVKLENQNGTEIYQQTATNSEVLFSEVVYGTYKVNVLHTGYQEYTHNNLIVESESVEHEVYLVSTSIGIGDKITFGIYDWVVLDIQDGKALIMCENLTEQRLYHHTNTEVTWESSSLRAYLNGEFFNSAAFSNNDRSRIVEVNNINGNNQWYGTNGGANTNDRIFILSVAQVVHYFGDSGQLDDRPLGVWYIDDQFSQNRIATLNATPASWWLRSPGDNQLRAIYVHHAGNIFMDGYNVSSESLGVRPALWLEW
ncbi:MAG: carboxypeptidase-like regulatory domain-containing protein [Candidatus Cloacimonetes bacterium]|nr:carboxypeptidase-like regulatory domain-containing protein [Candidatus Cloacimonadota bacterium]